VPVEGAEWDADVLYAGTQKCLSAPPGLAPFAVGARALEAVRARKAPPRTWLGDLGLLQTYWGGEGGRTYHHTAPVNAIYGLHESLRALEEEGLAAAWARHRRLGAALDAGLGALGLGSPVPLEHRMPQLTAVLVPEGVDEAAVRARMLERFGVEIGAGLGPFSGRVWRIGLMGASATALNVRLCLTALAEALAAQGPAVSATEALAACDAVL
jgi:alanine-glyoxylate transaminase/serine-glyoxylate transaminase/serine-pyruvate transaminase